MRRILKSRVGLLVIMAIAAVTFLALVPQAQATEYWKQKFERFSATAGATLSVGDVAYIKSSDSKAYKADADNSSARPAVGVIGKGGSAGDTVEIVVRGILAGQTAASPGTRLFLSDTAGAISVGTSPSAGQNLGWVLPGTSGSNSSTDYYISVEPPANTVY